MRLHAFRRSTVLASALIAAAPLAALAATTGHQAKAPASFTSYVVTDGHQNVRHGGEPSIGYDPTHDAVIFGTVGTETLMKFRGLSVTQKDISVPGTHETPDPLTFVDRQTGRIFDDQLLGGCSKMFYSDDAGSNWTPTTGCGGDVFLRHQSV